MSSIESDMYQKMKSDNLIEYAEKLCALKNNGLTQIDIAQKLNINRQMIGRYQKIGMWPDSLKDFVQNNRSTINNTTILNAAMSGKTADEIYEAFQKIVSEKSAKENPVKTNLISLPSSSVFTDIKEEIRSMSVKITSLEERLNSKTAVEFEAKDDKSSAWDDISFTMYQPSAVFYLICISMLSMYLMYQNFIFFSSIEKNSVSAIANSFIADFIPMLAAGCLSFSVSKSQRLFCSGVLLASIIGLGLFMHSSVKSSLVNQSETSQSLAREKSILFGSLEEEIKTLKSLPETHITRRQELEGKIRQDRQALSLLNERTTLKVASATDIDSTALGYGVWLRVAAMLMNAYLIHLLFKRFH